ncbi:hypothetical protein RQP46_002868 [Phenoliferia psychrophenolica]
MSPSKITQVHAALAAIVTSARRAGTETALTPGELRRLLAEEHGLEWTDVEWKATGRPQVKTEAHRLLTLSSSPVKPASPAVAKRKAVPLPSDPEPPKKASKYERAAEKNLEIFKAMTGLDDGGDESPESADHTLVIDDESEEEGESDASAEPVAVVKPKSKPQKTEKKPRVNKGKDKAVYKSRETISSDADDDGASGSGSRSRSRSATASVEVEDAPPEKKKRRKSGEAAKEKKPRAKKESVAKAGDAPKGTADEESRITKLKALCVASGSKRPFNAATGAERLLSVAARTTHLERLLNDVGLKCTSGSLPSLSKAKKIGERRELEREMQDISGAPVIEGLRDGKKVRAVVEDSESEDEPPRKAPVKKFGAFLGGLQSDSD